MKIDCTERQKEKYIKSVIENPYLCPFEKDEQESYNCLYRNGQIGLCEECLNKYIFWRY